MRRPVLIAENIKDLSTETIVDYILTLELVVDRFMLISTKGTTSLYCDENYQVSPRRIEMLKKVLAI